MRKFLSLVLLTVFCFSAAAAYAEPDTRAIADSNVNYGLVSKKLLSIEKLLKKGQLTPEEVS